jgi:hypothetical protein
MPVRGRAVGTCGCTSCGHCLRDIGCISLKKYIKCAATTSVVGGFLFRK